MILSGAMVATVGAFISISDRGFIENIGLILIGLGITTFTVGYIRYYIS